MTQNLLPFLASSPYLAVLLRGEDQEGAEHEVILSYRLWQRRFNGDRNVVGKPITLDGEAYTVVGVMPARFRFAPFWATHAERWVADSIWQGHSRPRTGTMRVFAPAQARCHTYAGQGGYRDCNRPVGKTEFPQPTESVSRPLKENVVGKIETPLTDLLGAVGFVPADCVRAMSHTCCWRARRTGKRRSLCGLRWCRQGPHSWPNF